MRQTTALVLVLLAAGALPLFAAAESASPPIASEAASADQSLAQRLAGAWTMQGRFRYKTDMDWIPTRSSLVAEQQLGRQIVLRNIEAAQVNLFAVDWISLNEETGVVQYFYTSNQAPTSLIFEGRCADSTCTHLELSQVCGPLTNQYGCAGRTTLTFESDEQFVARDFRPSPDGEEFMSREVYYTRASSEPAAP